MSWRAHLEQSLNRFRHDATGVAAVEFALILPIMLLLYIGAVEASSLISMDRRVQTIAGTMGDLVARANGKISACEIKDYFQAASGIMAPYPVGDTKQIVTSVFVKPNGTTEIAWSKAAGGATPHVAGQTYPLPAEMKAISLNTYVIVSEATYDYLPITGFIYEEAIQLRRENFFLTRFEGAIDINPTSTAACPG
ncbi:TadE/TadG family type IV pilus assembly protein [uncultured Devosia sp.]|uniref:TadE/TadG family type IV pilus assembly protein n=1 Tax=uncultured Devosia sp. TaxID=211434 RepID=UPI0035CA0518